MHKRLQLGTLCGMPIAQRLYLDDSLLSQFRATVTDIREYARKDGVQVWQIALDRTAFYPTGGGQPYDRGSLRAKARSGAELTVPVDDVLEDEAGEVWHATTKPLLTGTIVSGSVDMERRLDHTQQHTGQHLLSAVLAEEFGMRTVSFHMGAEDATIDIASESSDTEDAALARLAESEQLALVEQRVNRHIAQNTPVCTRVVSNKEAQALLAAGRLRKLPPRSGDIRLVEIAGLDLNACGGTHVQALGQVGGLQLRQIERIKKNLRLHFVCGLRAVRAARADFEALSAAAGVLSVGSSAVAEAVQRLQAEARSLAKERLRLRDDIATRHAVQLAVEERIHDGLRVVCRTFADRDADYVKLLAMRLLEAVPHTAAILVSTTEEPATLIVACNMASDTEAPKHCSNILRGVLAPFKLRGGGTAQQAQALVPAELLTPVSEELVRRLTLA